MRKRIALFILGLIVAVCAFWVYQYLSGASFLGARKATVPENEESRMNHAPTYEQRAPNGDLLYLLTAQKAAPLKDENGKPIEGQYDLTEPAASYYTTDGNLLFIRSDRGTVTVNDRGTSSHAEINDRFRGAHLSGNVVLTYGPRDSFVNNTLDIQPGQLQVRFEKDLDLNYTEGVVTSPGLVHVRVSNGTRFDGENLTIAFNRSQKKQEIEVLRIEPTSGKTNYMLIKDVGRQGFSLDQPTTKPAAAGASVAAGGTSAASSTTKAGNPVATSQAATGPAIAGTQPAKGSKSTAVVYKVSLGTNVTATLGGRKLTSDQLFVFFQTPPKRATRGPATAKSTDNAATPPASTGPAPTTAAAPASAPASAPAAKQEPDDLVVTWTGAMEMKPVQDEDNVHLVDPHDIALRAVGTPQRPVIVNDDTRVARAGTLHYDRFAQSIDLEPGTVGPVVITEKDAADPVRSLRTLTCQGVRFSRNDDQVHLAGPGRVEVPQSVLNNDPRATGEPLVVEWEKMLDIEVLPTESTRNAKRNGGGGPGYVVRRALFTGKASITNVNFHLDSQALDIAVAPPVAGSDGGTKASQALEHLLATGAVHVKFANRTGAGIAEKDKPSGLNADRLEVRTVVAAGAKAPSPSRLLAEGNVEAWAYQPEQGSTGVSPKLSKQTLYTPKFDVALAPKAKSSKESSASSAMANVTYTSMTATDGVIVELEGFSPQTIFAKGKTLTADLSHGREAATVTLYGDQAVAGNNGFAEVSQGERGDNKITGLKILLDQKNKSIDIPGRGTFDFVQPPQKQGGEPMPAEVTWTKSMHYDSRSMLAHFVGDIDAHLVGKTDQISKLTCNDYFDVQLAGEAPAGGASTGASAGATTAPAHTKLHLASIVAHGNVQVQGTNLDPAGKVLTSIFLTKTDRLNYTEATKTLEIPGPGQLLIQDYRADAKAGGKSGTNAGSSHGDTVFTWTKSLTYVGPTGTITFLKDVYMKHMPLKPFKVPGTGKPPANAAAPQPNPPLTLTTDMLVAKLDQSKSTGGGDTVASPIAMGSGGNQQLSNVMADGHSVMKLGESSLTSQRLTFDNHTHIATAIAKDMDTPAEIFRPGEGITQADEIHWDMTKDKNAVELVHPRGGMQQN